MSKLVVASSNPQLDILLEIVCVKLQLSDTQFNTAESRYHSIGDWLLALDSSVRQYDPEVYAQGSLNLGTVIKPHGSTEFDLDLICELQLPRSTRPSAVYKAIWERMSQHKTYKSLMKKERRCIRLIYANDFHLDIVPAIPDPDESGGHVLVPDLSADLELDTPVNDEWKPSNPKGYKHWFKQRCDTQARQLMEARASAEGLPQPEPIHKKPALKRAVQLFKRWRDIQYEKERILQPSSIILTTLSGHFYGGESLSSDVLDHLLASIVQMRNKGRFDCQVNPANNKENIFDRWNGVTDSLNTFDERIRTFQREWDDLLQTQGLPKITAELKRLFGENPIDAALKEYVERHINQPRENSTLVMERSTGSISAAASAAAPAIPLKRTSFYGR
jgi:hypothetical protein